MFVLRERSRFESQNVASFYGITQCLVAEVIHRASHRDNQSIQTFSGDYIGLNFYLFFLIIFFRFCNLLSFFLFVSLSLYLYLSIYMCNQLYNCVCIYRMYASTCRYIFLFHAGVRGTTWNSSVIFVIRTFRFWWVTLFIAAQLDVLVVLRLERNWFELSLRY